MNDPTGAAYEWFERPDITDPVLVVMLLGWIDAGGAAAGAMAVLEQELAARPVLRFDADTFIDYRARRPLLQLREGVIERMIWPITELKTGRDAVGHDVLLLTGQEPDSAWELFLDSLLEVSAALGVTKVVGLGAYPFATPHSRPSRLSITCGSRAVAESLPYLRNSVDVPAGIAAAIEARFSEHGIPSFGLWAQVPHYVAAAAYPAATVALLSGLNESVGIVTEAVPVRQEAIAQRSQLDELVSGNAEHVAMLRQLEQMYDSEDAPTRAGPGLVPSDLPSGDELAAELERFLRDQGS
ncbi:MAG TPA: PAC2 family protein [Acidimicrobiales bacterium]|nr:PAC2 family protein [Acidimicrobiales bacterium]